MMMCLAGAIGAMGLVCMISRRTLLGVLLGVQLLALGATLMFVFAGASTGEFLGGSVFGTFVALGGIAQLGVGYAVAVRIFYLKKNVTMSELRTLKQ